MLLVELHGWMGGREGCDWWDGTYVHFLEDGERCLGVEVCGCHYCMEDDELACCFSISGGRIGSEGGKKDKVGCKE